VIEDDARILGYDSDMYLSQLADDAPPMITKNWCYDDLVSYIGGEYAVEDYKRRTARD
jgi:hypothetical protein